MGQKVSPIGLWLGITHKHQSNWFIGFIRNFITPKFPRASIARILIFRTVDYIKVEVQTAPSQNLGLAPWPRPEAFRQGGELYLFSDIKSRKENLNDKADLQDNIENRNLNSAQNDTYNPNLSDLNGDNVSFPRFSEGKTLKNIQEDLKLALEKYKRKNLSLLFSNPTTNSRLQSDQPEENLFEITWLQPVNIGILIKQLNKPFQDASVFAKYLATQLEKRENSVKQAFNRSLRWIQNYKIWGIKIKVSGRLQGVDIAEHKSLFKGKVPLSTIDAKIDYSYETAKTLYGIIGVKVWIWHEEN
uniref:ribosomal protein S3 n=1 Tax=Cephaleuros parasiticus TaxID=173370 RepID=UPI001EDF6661|nr:ribosomal protein S3 [Cephaleuros parasiticus]UIB39034.1 ribosomal protein S3 [Cephaleuros parasiticus]